MSTEYKTSLPPRKRAKTKEEKEQRRVERILRNRRAAHASREKKRKHVEYLESYVLKLEENVERLQGNFDRLVDSVGASALEKVDIVDLDDLVQLKEQIHLNLNNSANSSGNANSVSSPDEGDGSEYGDSEIKQDDEEVHINNSTPTKKRKLDASSTLATPSSIASSAPSVHSVSEDVDAVAVSITTAMDSINAKDDLLSVASDNNSYYNYLSPISMNSPVNSPIDLKLETDGKQSLTLDTSSYTQDSEITKGFNSMGQSSEEILLPKSYDNMMMSIPC